MEDINLYKLWSNAMTRGGKRLGAGRPLIGDRPRVKIGCRVTPETKEWLTNAAERQGITITQLVGLAIERLREEWDG